MSHTTPVPSVTPLVHFRETTAEPRPYSAVEETP
jgi:hypothetical protein